MNYILMQPLFTNDRFQKYVFFVFNTHAKMDNVVETNTTWYTIKDIK